MKKYKEGDVVRLYQYPENDPNAYARINNISESGRVWFANLNMPFQGTLSVIVSKEQFEEMITYIK